MIDVSFKRFGKVNYVSDTKVGDFVKYLEEGKIMATKCSKCGKLYFPPRADCPDDMKADVGWHRLSGRCKLLTYTTAFFAPTGFQEDLPYSIALAQLEEGVNVYAQLSKDIDEKEIRVGMDLQLAPLRLSNGRITYELRKV